MKCISELKLILSQHLPWHKARIDFLARALVGMLISRSVNLREIAINMPSAKASINSRYKRLQRFFRHYSFDSAQIARWILQLFIKEGDKFYIAIDRTNWFWGTSKINIFMLSICYEGIAIPLLWTTLLKAGNSTGQEQISLLKRFVAIFGKQQIKGVLADREFPNKIFIGWLTKEEIHYYFRIKGDSKVCIKNKKFKRADRLFPNLTPYEHQVFGMKVTLFGVKLYLSASKNQRNELMIVVTNADPKIAIAIYLRRWEVESLFQALKCRGFRFEETHLTHLVRVERLLAVTALAFAWAHKIGEWEATHKKIPMKRFKGQRRPQMSYFKYGLDTIRDVLSAITVKISKFRRLIKHLKPIQASPMEVV